MTFEGQYLTYSEYQNLGGSAIGEMPFNLLEFEARRQIDIKTQNRLKNGINIPQEVKLCDKNLIDSIKTYVDSKLNINSDGIKSESIDGYSYSKITLDMIKDIVNSHKEDIGDIIRTYLLGVVYNGEHLMYAGV